MSILGSMGNRSALILVILLAAGGSAFAKKSADVVVPREYVDAHNAVRAAVQKPAGYTAPWVPVPPVVWSEEVAASAQEWADNLRDTKKCALMHSDTRYGENLANGKGMDAKQAVKLWESEIGKFRWVPVYEFEIVTGHYSQVVWRKTTHIGCGRAMCGKQAVIVCRYTPPGNHIGKAPF